MSEEISRRMQNAIDFTSRVRARQFFIECDSLNNIAISPV